VAGHEDVEWQPLYPVHAVMAGHTLHDVSSVKRAVKIENGKDH
jgi:hypothetical protein